MSVRESPLQDLTTKDSTIMQDATLKSLEEKKVRLQEDVTTAQKALNDKSTAQAQADAQRNLPQNGERPYPPLLASVLGIQDRQDTMYMEIVVANNKHIRDRDNAWIDHWAPILRKKIDEEKRLRRIWAEWRDGKKAESKARMQAALAKKKERELQKRIGLREITALRNRLKARHTEDGDFDVIGRENETLGDWWARMEKLSAPIRQDWNKFGEGIRAAAPRYVEGYPVRDSIAMPKVWTGYSRGSGSPPCWQCRVKGLRCSLEVTRYDKFGHVVGKDRACSRCIRAGDRWECCCKSNQLPFGWRWTEMSEDEKKALVEDPKTVNRKTMEGLKKWVDKNVKGLGVDFFNTHVQRFDVRAKRAEKRRAIGFNTRWWERKERAKDKRRYRDKMAKGGAKSAIIDSEEKMAKLYREKEERERRYRERLEELGGKSHETSQREDTTDEELSLDEEVYFSCNE